jgi:transposase InsO family protein
MPRQARMQLLRVNDAWSMDFVADQLADGTKIRLLTIIDIHSRESLAIVVGQRLRGEDVAAALNRIVEKRPPPKCLFVDNASEAKRINVPIIMAQESIQLSWRFRVPSAHRLQIIPDPLCFPEGTCIV